MDLDVIAKALNLKIFCGYDKMDTVVLNGYIGDLLSDVMANSQAGNIWVTRQVHVNIVAVASLKEHAAIVIVQGANPEKETIERATREGIPILVSDLPEFQLVGRIYQLIGNG